MHNSVLWLKTYISIAGKMFSYIVPAIISLFILSIIRLFLTPSFWLLLLIAFIISIPLILLYIQLNKIFTGYAILTETIVDILRNDIERHSEGLSERPGRVHPDTPMVNLKNYINAITSIKTNGFIEFSNCQNVGVNLKKKVDLMLYTITPGMFHYFMILSPGEDHDKLGYIRIYPPDDMDERDFTETWFNHIFPILGNLSNSVTEKLDGPYFSNSSPGHFSIRNYKIYRRGKKGQTSFRILF